MKPTHYITTLLITVSIMCLLVLCSQQNAPEREIIPPEPELAHTTSQGYTVEEIVIPETTQQATSTKPDRGGERGRVMEVTAYWEGSCGKAPDDPLYGITASGEYVQDGFIAAGPELKMGTKVYIPSLRKVFTVKDRGGMITNGHLDVYMTTHKACISFGRQTLEVYVMDKEG